MGPISRVYAGPTDPYLQWRERLEEKKAEKESGFAKDDGRVPARRTRDEYVPGPDRTPESEKLPGNEEEQDQNAGKADGTQPDQAAKKAAGKEPERCRCSTDKVDREIEKLKKRKKELEGQLRTEDDESKIQVLEQELAQVERELGRKDNDGYRRQHMVVTKM